MRFVSRKRVRAEIAHTVSGSRQPGRLAVAIIEQQLLLALLNFAAKQLAVHSPAQRRLAQIDERERIPGTLFPQKCGFGRNNVRQLRGGDAQRLEDRMCPNMSEPILTVAKVTKRYTPSRFCSK
jgi:hypothetical protein